jgi:hypothetical protein
MEYTMKCSLEETEAEISSIWSELEETIKHRLEDVLSCIDQKTQGIRKELTEKIAETQVDLLTLKSSVNTKTKSLQETLADTRNDLHE